MAFIPRLPTWNTEVDVYQWDGALGICVPLSTFTGQIYHAQRGQPGTMFGDLYIMYPKEDDIITDPAEYGARVWEYVVEPCDVVSFVQPSDGVDPIFYGVLQVHPRWLGFPNEHRICRLRRLTPTERERLLVGGDPVDAAASTVVASPTTVNADGVATTTITVHLVRVSTADAAGVTVSVTNSGSAVVDPAVVVTDASGNAVFTAVDSTDETVTFSAVWGGTPDVGPSNSVDYIPVGVPYAPNCTILFAPPSVNANLMDTISIEVTVRDFFNVELPGVTVTVSTDGVSITWFAPDTGTTNSGGEFVTGIQSDTVQSGISISAVADGVSIGPVGPAEFV